MHLLGCPGAGTRSPILGNQHEHLGGEQGERQYGGLWYCLPTDLSRGDQSQTTNVTPDRVCCGTLACHEGLAAPETPVGLLKLLLQLVQLGLERETDMVTRSRPT